jgi:hypothetical protein
MLDVACPHCGARVRFVPELVGREIFCLGCGSHYVIPDLRPEATKGEKPLTIKPIVVDDPRAVQPSKDRNGSQDTNKRQA